jgi:DNA-binding response OmpR family regulator
MNSKSGAGDKAIAKSIRILVIEDEPLIAESIRSDLVDAGFEVVGIAPRLDRAEAMIQEMDFDAAVVDANLAGASAAPAAAALSSRHVPFVVMSGYSPEQLSLEFSRALFLQKPYQTQQLVAHITSLVGRSGKLDS